MHHICVRLYAIFILLKKVCCFSVLLHRGTLYTVKCVSLIPYLSLSAHSLHLFSLYHLCKNTASTLKVTPNRSHPSLMPLANNDSHSASLLNVWLKLQKVIYRSNF